MKLLYPFILLLCMNAAAQKNLERYHNSRLNIKLNTLSILDPRLPTLQPGVEFRLKQRLTAELAMGIPLNLYMPPTDTTYSRYYKLKGELKFFPGDKRQFYLAPEIGYVHFSRSNYNGILVTNGDTYRYDYAELDKSIVTGALKIGFILPTKGNRPWYWDLFFGIGPRFVHLNARPVNLQPDGASWIFWREDRTGTSTSVHVTVGLKVGFIAY